jgi:hypothetical protein
MKENNTKPSTQNNSEEEIDLGQLFSMIGHAFSKLFSFFSNIIIFAYDQLINLFLFYKRHFIAVAAFSIIGAVSGYVFQNYIKTPTFESSMTVKPNYGSTVQLYKNIDYYQSLIGLQEYEKLASSFSISIDEAKSIGSIEAEPYLNDNQKLMAFRDFISDLDTNSVKLVDFEQFKENLPKESVPYHLVKVYSKDKYVFSKLEDPIIADIIRNDYYGKKKEVSTSNLIDQKSALENSLSELDSLKSLYSKLLILEGEKQTSGTNIVLADQNDSRLKEVIVFDKYLNIKDQILAINQDLTEQTDIINVTSSFNPIGMPKQYWFGSFAILGLVGGFLLINGILLFVLFNKFLEQVSKTRG